MDNGLALAPLDWVERRDGVIEGRGGSDVRVKMPVRTRSAISVSWLGTDSTTKSTVRPSAGLRLGRRLGLECPLRSSTGRTG